MKRLKYSCLFNGKTYPMTLTMLALVFGIPFGLVGRFPLLISAVLMLSPAIVLAVCYAIEHHLTEGERQIIADTSYPLWQPVTPRIKTLVIEQQRSTQMTLPQMLAACGTCAVVVFLMGIMPGRHSHKSLAPPNIMLVISLLCAAAVFVYLMVTKGIGANWMEIDETAVFTQIPIDHMYDVTHHSKHGRTWTESYLVFYLPDGRYVLHAPEGSGFGNTVTVVKFRGALMWTVTSEQHPEDYL